MINKFNIAKALYDNLKVVTDANSYTLVGNGVGHESDPNELYIEEFTLYGDDLSVGLSDDSSDIQIGIYQVNINTPKTQTKWDGLATAGIIGSAFNKGLQLTFGGQMVRIKNASIEPMGQDDTHFIHVLSITFSVVN